MAFDGATFLGDLVVPEVWAAYITKDSTKTNRLLNAGVISQDDILGSRLTEHGQYITIPVINDLYGEPQVWNDTSDIQVSSLTTSEHNAIKFYQAKAYGETDFGQLVSGVNVAQRVASRFSNYWNRQDERLILALLHNAFLISDMKEAKGYNIGNPQELNAGDFIAAMTRMGDVSDPTITRLLMNSAVVGAMKEKDLIDTVEPSQVGTSLRTYNGIPIVTDDQIPINADGTTRIYAVSNGAVRYSTTAAPDHGVEVDRNAMHNGGQTALINRRIVAMHLNGLGFDMTKFKPSNMSVTDFEGTTPMYELVSDIRNIGAIAYEFKIDPKFVVKGVHYNFTEDNDGPQQPATPSDSGSTPAPSGQDLSFDPAGDTKPTQQQTLAEIVGWLTAHGIDASKAKTKADALGLVPSN